VALGPVAARSEHQPASQQELAPPVSGAHQVLLGVFAATTQITHCFLVLGRWMDRRQQAGAQQFGQLAASR